MQIQSRKLALKLLGVDGPVPETEKRVGNNLMKAFSKHGRSKRKFCSKICCKEALVCFPLCTSKEHERLEVIVGPQDEFRWILLGSWLAVYVVWCRYCLCRMEIDSLLHKPVPCLHMQSVDIRYFGMELLTSNGLLACQLWRYCQMKVLGN